MHQHILLMRHGQTDGNRAKIIQGALDYPLNDRGLHQVSISLGNIRGAYDVKKVLSSPVKRARQTAEIAGQALRVEPRVVDTLTEVAVGAKYLGKTLSEINDPRIEDILELNPLYVGVLGGESIHDIYMRCNDALDGVLSFGEDTLIISHATNIQCLLCILLHLEKKRIPQFYIAEGGYACVELNGRKPRLKELFAPGV